MKLIDRIGIACTLTCAILATIDKDFTEVVAWLIVLMWNIKEFFIKPTDTNKKN